jgi:16S rRNA (adenine1518-N6/adenine1519-N6)-dimethyltransferase
MSISGNDGPTRPLSLEASTRELLRRHGLRARKGLGQNFLVDAEVLGQIAPAADVAAGDSVIEVGPGFGALTRELLAAGASVAAVELDDNLARILREEINDSRLSVINSSALKITPEAILAESGLEPPYKVVANIPYYITGPLLRNFLEAVCPPQLMVLMVQYEVAQLLAAPPGKMSLLSVSAQFYADVSLAFKVPAAAFMPPPKVDSAVVRLDVRAEPRLPREECDAFFKFVKAGFSNPRKQFANSLSRGLVLPKDETETLLNQASIDPMRRAGTLSIDEWLTLYRKSLEAGLC